MKEIKMIPKNKMKVGLIVYEAHINGVIKGKVDLVHKDGFSYNMIGRFKGCVCNSWKDLNNLYFSEEEALENIERVKNDIYNKYNSKTDKELITMFAYHFISSQPRKEQKIFFKLIKERFNIESY